MSAPFRKIEFLEGLVDLAGDEMSNAHDMDTTMGEFARAAVYGIYPELATTLREECDRIAKISGDQAGVFLSVSTVRDASSPAAFSLYPLGIGKSSAEIFSGPDFQAAFDAAEAWAKTYADDHRVVVMAAGDLGEFAVAS